MKFGQNKSMVNVQNNEKDSSNFDCEEAGDLHGDCDGNVKQRPQFVVILYT